MAYDSIPHDGITTGHAASTDLWSAPYSSAEWTDYWKKVFSSDAARGYIVPGYANSLRVYANSPVALNVLLATGAAFVRGRAFENTVAATMTLDTADATNPRIDRIILRYSASAQTIVPAVLTGTPGATPSMPSLTQTAATYEVSIAYIWVAATATTIANTEIHDERIFEANFESLLTSLMQTNLLTNSEFMAFTALAYRSTMVAGNDVAPEAWEQVGNVQALSGQTKPTQMSRGKGVYIQANAANTGISQTFPVKASTVYSIRALVRPDAGDVGHIQVTTDSASPGTISRYVRRTGTWLEETIYYTTEADATTMTISLLCLNNTDNVSYGQTLAVEGYHPGPFRQIHETIPFRYRITDSAWDGDVKADGNVTIDFDSDFRPEQYTTPLGVRGVFILCMAKDSGSAAGDDTAPLLQIAPNSTAVGPGATPVIELRFAGAVNSSRVAATGLVYLNNGRTIVVTTADQTALTAYIYLTGIVT